MEFTERVLVLQLGKFREADLWVRVLSPSRGLFTAFAFGGSRSRRRFVGCLDLFNEILVRVSASRRGNYLALEEGTLLRGVERLRHDWPRFGLAVNCVRFLQSLGLGPDGADKGHELLVRTLRFLEEAESVPRLFPFFFRARLVFDQGYSLEADRCAACAAAIKEAPAQLLVHEGHLLCRACADKGSGRRLPLGAEALLALESVRREEPEQWADLPLSPSGAREFARAVDGFVQYHVGIAWNEGRFVRL
ncbi:DNA repair protein RecO [Desulfovibrio sp. OttesenSCG-928-G11]|nr:DNA repair protein RecO [Desulfovibrio sp. OttesenSCG-928-G11]